MKKIILLILIIVFSCDQQQQGQLQKSSMASSELVKENLRCSEIFKDKFGIFPEDEIGYRFIDNWIKKINVGNANHNFTELTILQLKERGEVDQISRFAVASDSDGKVYLFVAENQNLKKIDLKNFTIKSIIKKIESSIDKEFVNWSNVLVIHFKEDKCTCHLFEEIQDVQRENIKNLTFFN